MSPCTPWGRIALLTSNILQGTDLAMSLVGNDARLVKATMTGAHGDHAGQEQDEEH